ncbi:MAG: tryptophan synthase subunit alpha, partial [Casimicrobiaceae bacterium]
MPATRIERTLAALLGQGRTALIPYVTTGDPTLAHTLPLMHALIGAGADIIELGVPFSDPMADGPVIQRASERALAQHVGLADVLDVVRAFRATNDTTPVVLMGYLNPVEAMGAREFVTRAAASGVDGVILVDCPPEEMDALHGMLDDAGIAPVFLIAPTTPDARIAEIGRIARGYAYYVSLKGVTGAANLDAADVGQRVAAIRKHLRIPVGVGFGIRDAASAQAVAAHADAVVIGTRLIQEMEDGPADTAIARAAAWLAT